MTDLNQVVIGIDHIGYAVKDIPSAQKILAEFGYEFGTIAIDENQNVCVAVGVLGETRVELLSPINGKKSPIDGILSKNGATPYHICYQVKSIQMAAEHFRGQGFFPLGAPTKSKPLGGEVCFLYSKEIGVIELIEHC